MKDSINKLKNEFSTIKKLGYVKAVNNCNSGIGLTFEKLLGKDVDYFSYADYEGIELKTKNINTKTPISLFKLTPYGKDFFETKRILKEYGYHLNSNDYKVFYGKVYGNSVSKIGHNFFSLKTNYEKKQIELIVYDNKKNIIENETFWDFNKIENVLHRKINYLALIKAKSKVINNEKYYSYIKIKICKLISFEKFFELIDVGKVFILFSIDIFKSGKRIGQFHDHGTAFCIYENYLDELYTTIDTL